MRWSITMPSIGGLATDSKVPTTPLSLCLGNILKSPGFSTAGNLCVGLRSRASRMESFMSTAKSRGALMYCGYFTKRALPGSGPVRPDSPCA